MSLAILFNQGLVFVSFFVRWHDSKESMLAMIDVLFRCEEFDDKFAIEIAQIKNRWIYWAKVISGCINSSNIRLALISKEAYYLLGPMERALAVRHAQFMKMNIEDPEIDKI